MAEIEITVFSTSGIARKVGYSLPEQPHTSLWIEKKLMRELRVLLSEFPAGRFYAWCAVLLVTLLVYVMS